MGEFGRLWEKVGDFGRKWEKSQPRPCGHAGVHTMLLPSGHRVSCAIHEPMPIALPPHEAGSTVFINVRHGISGRPSATRWEMPANSLTAIHSVPAIVCADIPRGSRNPSHSLHAADPKARISNLISRWYPWAYQVFNQLPLSNSLCSYSLVSNSFPGNYPPRSYLLHNACLICPTSSALPIPHQGHSLLPLSIRVLSIFQISDCIMA